eukprot:3940347-Rhodomonas_salina.2
MAHLVENLSCQVGLPHNSAVDREPVVLDVVAAWAGSVSFLPAPTQLATGSTSGEKRWKECIPVET